MKIEQMIPKLIRAGYEGDKRAFEVIASSIATRIKKTDPKIAEEINNILCYKGLGTSSYRSIGMNDLPKTKKTNDNLLTVEEPNDIIQPILTEKIKEQFDRFILEQESKLKLMEFGVKSSNTILLYGEPGVGKTYSAKWLSYKLNKPLLNLNLATVVSSLLGETGSNIKSVLDYAKEVEGILFLDEFDSIAKKRDDDKDIGELKRIVNVLLKELEQWPMNGVVIAATNHPDMLDKAIWRRFDLKIEMPLPDKNIRYEIIKREFDNINFINEYLKILLAELTYNINSAEIVRICENIKKNFILYNHSIDIRYILNLVNKENIDNKELCILIKKSFDKIKANEISDLTGIPVSSVYRYLK